MIVLRAEKEIYHHDRDRRGGHDQQAEGEEQEAEHVVDPTTPEGVHDEEQLDEDGAEG